jgi:hypothetical protein
MVDITGPLVSRRKIILVALEAIRGTPEATPTIPVLCLDPKIDCKTPYQPRQAAAFCGHRPGMLGEMIGTLSFQMDLMGNGIPATPAHDPGLEAMLQACGMALNGTTKALTPLSSPATQKTATIFVYEDGLCKGLSGAAGTPTIECAFGKPATVKFEMSGVWIDPIDDEMPEVELPTILPPRCVAVAFTLGTNAARLSKVTLKLGNQVTPREDINSAGGVLHYCVTDRDVQVVLDTEAELVDTYNLFGAWKTGALAALSMVLGTEIGNKITIAAPAVQYREIAEADRGGKLTHDLTGQCTWDAGDDEFSLTPAPAV